MDYTNITSFAYQGIPGSYSHAVANKIAPNATHSGFLTFEETLRVVEDEKCMAGLVPIENNIGGRVAEVHQLLNHTGLKIVAEHFHPINHCLLALRDTTLDNIKSIRSHPQALLQCSKFIKDNQWLAVGTHDTAYAAQELADSKNNSVAVISSELCAEIYNLQILKRNIANDWYNVTRFIILRKANDDEQDIKNPITSILMQVRSVPAALYKSLGGFATSGINILKIESYVEPMNFNVARFYMEIAGNINSQECAHAYAELRYYTAWVRVLGIFSGDKFRS